MSTSREPIIVREASWTTIILVLVVTFALITSIAVPAIVSVLTALGDSAANLIIFGAIFLSAICVIAFGVGGLRPRDVGLRFGKLFEAIVVVALAWIFIQMAHAVASLIDRGSVRWDDAWQGFTTESLIWLLAMVAGTALTEETVFRGFLFPQLNLKSSGSQRARFWKAAIASALLFGLLHVPRHIIFGNMPALALSARVLAHSLGGLLAITVFLRTRNLWIVIGLHGIDNAPTRLFESPMPSEPVLLLVEIVLLLFWPWLSRRPEHKGLAPVMRD